MVMSEHDFGDPVHPTLFQKRLNLHSSACNYAILRSETHSLVHFAEGLPQVLFDMTAAGEARDLSRAPESAALRLEMTQKLLSHRMIHPESTFAQTMVVDGGVRRGTE